MDDTESHRLYLIEQDRRTFAGFPRPSWMRWAAGSKSTGALRDLTGRARAGIISLPSVSQYREQQRRALTWHGGKVRRPIIS